MMLIGFSTDTENVIQDVRLVDGTSNRSGRIEVLFNGRWGTVCEDGWGSGFANVTCRQLGYTNALVIYGNAFFGEGNGSIWLNGLHCYGNESLLSDCKAQASPGVNCNHSQDVGVLCGSKKDSSWQIN
ncbi:Neurotrypsin [Holothuria leucospilota]|uniref:Neurotrypsin n=1 Tax=Holothuria leucospilota TaxID=206669 RepID=A0A9Q1CEC0_HOLLE|nr:Neurotrypsin [Holothuria leucospilota]